VGARAEAKTPEIVAASRQYGELYFDGPRCYGYGGYRYDGRWIPVAEDIVGHFGLKAGDRVLDVGCAKGFLVKDLMKVCPGLEAFGIDVSVRPNALRARGRRAAASGERDETTVSRPELQRSDLNQHDP
jgi:cyclopropane fatty-acyl-phospholipid synthase-like methyltransferase